MHFIEVIIDYLKILATKMPVEVFAFVGSFIEEVIAPVPSPIVMTLSGSLASAEGKVFVYLFWISFVAAIGKTLGGLVLYIITDKAEDILTTRFGKMLGITHKEIESIGDRIDKGMRDDIVLLVLRSLPVVPSAPISVVCGLIKMDIKTFTWATFVGTFIRNMFYLVVGYSGLESYQRYMHGLEGVESVVQIVIVAAVGGFLVWGYIKRGELFK